MVPPSHTQRTAPPTVANLDYVRNMGYLIHDFATMCPQHKTTSRNILIDMGGESGISCNGKLGECPSHGRHGSISKVWLSFWSYLHIWGDPHPTGKHLRKSTWFCSSNAIFNGKCAMITFVGWLLKSCSQRHRWISQPWFCQMVATAAQINHTSCFITHTERKDGSLL